MRHVWWIPLAILEGLANSLPILDCYPFLFFCFEGLVDRASFLVPDRHFALLLDLEM